jgi:hypothetical protein
MISRPAPSSPAFPRFGRLESAKIGIRRHPGAHIPDKMRIRKETSYYLPPGYHVEQHCDLLVLHRSDTSVVANFDRRQAIGEIVERHAWEDCSKRGNSRLGQQYERFLELPVAMVLGILWLLGIVPLGSCAAALLYVWTLLC